MTYHDKIQVTFFILAPPDQVAEADRIFKSHGSWMEATHHRSGEKALLSYKRLQGAGALQPDGSQLCPNRQHVFRPERDL